MLCFDRETMARFLVAAKRATYASTIADTDVPPLLRGSRQMEYRNGKYLYRDIYFGSAYFAGQETVEFEDAPVWAMVYSGGMTVSDPDPLFTTSVYRFLKQALRLVDEKSIYRGPTFYQEGVFIYRNQVEGNMDMFWGRETIFSEDRKVYELRYSGGVVR